MATYRFEDHIFDAADPDAQPLLARIHASHGRARCLCIAARPEMYVAHLGDAYFIKRMPDTGFEHAGHCSSYEPPAELSGLGEVLGSAIREDVAGGLTQLRFAFSLSKSGARTAPIPSGVSADTVEAEPSKLTLRATLDYLWDQAELAKWHPAMRGKRNWAVIRKYLLLAAQGAGTKSANLADLLYIPEGFSVQDSAAIATRRAAKLASFATAKPGSRKLLIVVGEVKEFGAARYGHKIVLRHMPDWPLLVSAELLTAITKRFAAEIAAWSAIDAAHLVIIATIGLTAGGFASVEEAALMLTNSEWLPFSDASDFALLEALHVADRAFVKSLRYNLNRHRPLAAAVTTDCRPLPVALYVVPAEPHADYVSALDELVGRSRASSWFWRPASDPMPALPSSQGFPSMPIPAFDTSNAVASEK
jgi:Protein of unknown function (DUF1173)